MDFLNVTNLTMDAIHAKLEAVGITPIVESNCRQPIRTDTVVNCLGSLIDIMVASNKLIAYIYAEYYDYNRYAVDTDRVSIVVSDYISADDDRYDTIINSVTIMINDYNNTLRTVPYRVMAYADKCSHRYRSDDDWLIIRDPDMLLRYVVLDAIYDNAVNDDDQYDYYDDINFVGEDL